MTITAQSWNLLDAIRREEFPEPEPVADEPLPPIFHQRSDARQSRKVDLLPPKPKNCSGYASPDGQPLPGEVSLKDWLIREGQKLNIQPRSVYHRWRDGKYPDLKLRKVNPRIIFVIL